MTISLKGYLTTEKGQKKTAELAEYTGVSGICCIGLEKRAQIQQRNHLRNFRIFECISNVSSDWRRKV